MSVSTLSSSIAASTALYDVEYRAIPDDAWYSVRAVVDGEKLTIKYENFADDFDNVFRLEDFKSLQEIQDFEERFRPVSVQLQDRQCKSLCQGTAVCASHSFNDLDVRFYDAVVDDVICRDHSFANGEEQCRCTFVVIWQHGPVAGCLANKNIESVCLLQSNAKLDPRVASFLKIARGKLATGVHKPPLHSNSETIHKDVASLPMNPQESKCGRLSVTSRWKSEELERICNHALINKEDTDVGGNFNRYVVLIDNLDKELSPSTIVQFIHSQTSVLVQAYVFPSLPSEVYTNGVIVLDSEKNLQKLSEFLDSPNHIIMSCRGRPWLVTKMLSGGDTYWMLLGTLTAKYQNKLEHKNIGIGHLKVVYSGSEEYRTAKQLKDLFMEFVEHQQRLHRTLALEERKFLQQSPAV